MHDLDAVEKAPRAYVLTDRASPKWQQFEDDFRRLAADPHTILYLVTAVKALSSGQAATRETRMLVNLVQDLADYVENSSSSNPDPARDYLLIQAHRVLTHHHL
ncbi:hypothetical protein [Noviherbaspirillum saxi]|uniref:hypothetical protein n=1 Tax=Noviherbaspirillum saxi TaxID=2320863 RepID=UPI0011C39F37|nr:hypothetical protein [Noviherbaspirillum saxi]